MIQDVPKRAISEVQASTSQIPSESILPQEKLKLAYKLMGVSSRMCRVLKYKSTSVLIFLFVQEALGGRVAKPRMIQS